MCTDCSATMILEWHKYAPLHKEDSMRRALEHIAFIKYSFDAGGVFYMNTDQVRSRGVRRKIARCYDR